ncbi:hypothetical protein Pmani_026416 [Petrolisthes manimaculis]|uniref:Uncharacterized protein n=1 Tax=Petrolisthes manimaculis TaxID=1843537 RepID=A0AAE1U054_9EUCA|nr:hypothetical protein Pmani_026416 [Petrolisthes manimaculis]
MPPKRQVKKRPPPKQSVKPSDGDVKPDGGGGGVKPGGGGGGRGGVKPGGGGGGRGGVKPGGGGGGGGVKPGGGGGGRGGVKPGGGGGGGGGDEAAQERFVLELRWCVEQIEAAIQNKKGSAKQTKEKKEMKIELPKIKPNSVTPDKSMFLKKSIKNSGEVNSFPAGDGPAPVQDEDYTVLTHPGQHLNNISELPGTQKELESKLVSCLTIQSDREKSNSSASESVTKLDTKSGEENSYNSDKTRTEGFKFVSSENTFRVWRDQEQRQVRSTVHIVYGPWSGDVCRSRAAGRVTEDSRSGSSLTWPAGLHTPVTGRQWESDPILNAG